MKIEDITESVEISITTDEEEYNEYVRYSADNWYVWMGESLEPHYSCEEQEKAYQEYLNNNNIKEPIQISFTGGIQHFYAEGDDIIVLPKDVDKSLIKYGKQYKITLEEIK